MHFLCIRLRGISPENIEIRASSCAGPRPAGVNNMYICILYRIREGVSSENALYYLFMTNMGLLQKQKVYGDGIQRAQQRAQ